MIERRLPLLEIAVTSAADALVAAAGGADRIELCQALEVGGLGPTAGQIELSVETGVAIHVLVRPRPGDFVYSPAEVATMERDVAVAVRLGAAGVVIGALTPDARLDVETLRRLIAATEGAGEVTLHRAIDRAADPVGDLPSLAHLGIDRVLTSGGSPTVAGGLATGVLARMVHEAGPVDIMAGGGLREQDVTQLLGIGVAALHLSASAPATVDRGDRLDSTAAGHRLTDGVSVAIFRRLLDSHAR